MAKQHILVVEDDLGIRESLVEVLEGEGFIIIAARDGFEALEKLKQQPILPCWILLDIMMPRMNGKDCLAAIRSNPEWENIPITFLSAAGRIEDISIMHKVDFLNKPIDLDVLLASSKLHCC
ncbi:MAG: hypothetical protein A2451_07665 [Bdellovibrionales bacterium RIFOXYC2_FULL_39_8]|nr:MAG: hypothetical protein A2385_01875 [Bdellovibrionales bacterium RIFOXYB1_FULL_39_21]OFZ43656.1 MAG: hypothetical protein A2485_15895 [Bdellovibrionales bacterium RIFOXYC12_FULL_39_17]OFZ47585.1 MAG: hypothetical protein A2404_14045 [Bdellovibrionales bacterium RIFOXYC1_FULL_39_130]OFZ73254.1 MAG: hypothetical protein A2451_07665 [Bdellovibrionales bacterium RIFOXYC2_FULL_39_8]OFZ76111.1 MAG: hypothetical protein A2560_16635 [Bdellovibrionales bacterium RIFOXYD1_FULL_39_84]